MTHPGVEAALSPVELVLFGAGLAHAPRVHLGRLGLDVRVVEAAQHDAEVQHGKPSEESISIMGSFLPAVQHAAGLQALILSSPKFKKFDN